MIEVTVTEVVLFGWAMFATLQAFKYKHERNVAAYMIREFIEDEGVRNEVIRKYKEATHKRA